MRRYTQLAYLFHQCATSLLSRDSRIADCTVRHPGVERPFSSLAFSIGHTTHISNVVALRNDIMGYVDYEISQCVGKREVPLYCVLGFEYFL